MAQPTPNTVALAISAFAAIVAVACTLTRPGSEPRAIPVACAAAAAGPLDSR